MKVSERISSPETDYSELLSSKASVCTLIWHVVEGGTFEFGRFRGVNWASCSCSASVIIVGRFLVVRSLCSSFFLAFFLPG